MKTLLSAILLLASSLVFSQSVFSPELSNHLQTNKSIDEYVEVNIFFENVYSLEELALSLDENNANFDTRVKAVVSLLKENAEISQSQFDSNLTELIANDKKAISDVNYFWGVNMINVTVKSKYLYSISDYYGVKYMDKNSGRYRLTETGKPIIVNDKALDEAEPGIKIANAHKLWELGYTGRNILFLSMDTGVFPDHPAISDNFAGNNFPLSQCWFGIRSSEPYDHASSSHGTHTTGTVLGLDPATHDTIGVAFNAKWIASDPVASSDTDLLNPADFMAVFEWVFDPDGNPETTDDVPRVINNSWGYDYALAAGFGACEMTEVEVLIAMEVAGICSPFSAGNDGPGVSTTGFPAMRAFNEVNPMSVGALSQGNDIASFSSRGPTPCIDEENSLQIKPEVCATGMQVRSCAGNDSYALLQGTSMSCPHVSGVLVLLAEAFPMASAYELKYSLYETAIDMGDVGEDNVFGRGLIDALAAYNYLALTYTPEPPITNEYDLIAEIQTPTDLIICPDDKTFQTQITVTNNGTETITNFNIKIYLNDVLIVDSLVEASLASTDVFAFTSETFEFDYGKNYLHTSVKPVEGFTEFDRFNNADIEKYFVIVEDAFPYLTEFNDFNSDLSDSDWLIVNPDNAATWKNLTWGSEDQNQALGLNFGKYGTREWEEDYANLPIIAVPDQDDIYFNFTYAYKKRVEHIFKDSLLVEISTDCGLTYQDVLWRNGGIDMATVEGNANLNVYKPESYTEFDTVSLSLADYKGEDVLIRFTSKNDKGSVIYIDRAGINQNMLETVEVNLLGDLAIYPNPASGEVSIEIFNIEDSNFIEIFNYSGQLVEVVPVSYGLNRINIEEFSAGIYFIRLSTTGASSKLVVE